MLKRTLLRCAVALSFTLISVELGDALLMRYVPPVVRFGEGLVWVQLTFGALVLIPSVWAFAPLFKHGKDRDVVMALFGGITFCLFSFVLAFVLTIRI